MADVMIRIRPFTYFEFKLSTGDTLHVFMYKLQSNIPTISTLYSSTSHWVISNSNSKPLIITSPTFKPESFIYLFKKSILFQGKRFFLQLSEVLILSISNMVYVCGISTISVYPIGIENARVLPLTTHRLGDAHA